MKPVYILGIGQSDFARNWGREDLGLEDMIREGTLAALADAGVEPAQVEAAHIGNFVGELSSQQGQLGGLFANVHPDLAHVATARHEGACASGSLAIMAALAEINAGFRDLVVVVGVEMMRHISGAQAAAHLGVAADLSKEAVGAPFVWPELFSQIMDETERRFGLDHEHLFEISRTNYDNARTNPRAQSRPWQFGPTFFTTDDVANPRIAGHLRKSDCGQITDGVCALVLASPKFAQPWAWTRKKPIAEVPKIIGFGQASAPMLLADKLKLSAGQPLMFPHLKKVADQALRSAQLETIDDVDVIELHDCFSISEYLAVSHLGLASPQDTPEFFNQGHHRRDGQHPINPSGGLIGQGHPVGASGVRMVADVTRQVMGVAEGFQVKGAKRGLTFNIGGSFTTAVSFVVTAVD